MRYFLLAPLLLLLSFIPADTLPKPFLQALAQSGMQFRMPQGFVPARLEANDQMDYDYGIRHGKEKFEVRYALRPLKQAIQEYKLAEAKKKKGDINLNPNTFYKSSLQAVCLNLSGGQLPEIGEFDKRAVKQEFNANWGATAVVKLGSSFGRHYTYCAVVALHKDNVADAYLFFLADRQEQLRRLLDTAFHTVYFR